MIDTIAGILIWAVPVVLAITLHEAAHGYVARHFGDPTAERAGRITLNPLRHIDPVGTIAVPLGIYLLSSSLGNEMLFGWAKPVPVNFARLRNPRANMLWVAAAGPLANLAMAIAWTLALALADDGTLLAGMAFAGILINGALMFLNLLPILPLDGGRIVASLLPDHLARKFARTEPYGILIVLALLASHSLGAILGPLLEAFARALMMLAGH